MVSTEKEYEVGSAAVIFKAETGFINQIFVVCMLCFINEAPGHLLVVFVSCLCLLINLTR